MDRTTLVIGLAGVLTSSAPIVVATIGETFAERAGVINLSVNGTILLSAMASFVVAVTTHSIVLGFITGAVVVLGFITFVPELVLWLPRAVGYKG